MDMNINTDIPSLAEIAAAKRAAHTNATHWAETFGRPCEDLAQQEEILAAGHRLDDVHADELAEELGLDDGSDLPREQALRVWPVYRAALVLRVYELLAAESAADGAQEQVSA